MRCSPAASQAPAAPGSLRCAAANVVVGGAPGVAACVPTGLSAQRLFARPWAAGSWWQRGLRALPTAAVMAAPQPTQLLHLGPLNNFSFRSLFMSSPPCLPMSIHVPPTVTCKVTFDYDAEKEDELTLREGGAPWEGGRV